MFAMFQSRGVLHPRFPHVRINNHQISFPSFKLSSIFSIALFLSPSRFSHYLPFPSPITEISTSGDFRVGASNIKQPRFHAATNLGDESGWQGRTGLCGSLRTSEQLRNSFGPVIPVPLAQYFVTRNYICSLISSVSLRLPFSALLSPKFP